MKKKATFISKSNIITINDFLNHYINNENSEKLKYKGDKKLTHNVLREFLFEKQAFIPKRESFIEIKKEDINSFKYLFVKDEANKVIPYFNPLYSVDNIKKHLDEDKRKLDLVYIRESLLAEINIKEIEENIVEINDHHFLEEEYKYYDDIEYPKKDRMYSKSNKKRRKK